jgi:negative regulator of sigma E activity
MVELGEMICPILSNSQFETKIMSWISNGTSHGFSQHRAARRQLQDLQPVHVSTFGAASSSLRVNVGSDGSVVT